MLRQLALRSTSNPGAPAFPSLPSAPLATTDRRPMKFGKIFRQTTETRMPQWRDHMLGYKALKQAIKQQHAQGTHGN